LRVTSRGLGDVYKRQDRRSPLFWLFPNQRMFQFRNRPIARNKSTQMITKKQVATHNIRFAVAGF
jgi:hypothetical protein